MAKLAPLLERLFRHDEAAQRAGEASAKLVLASGRRGRIEGDGDFETVSAAALSEDEVRDLLGQTGGSTRIDRLDAKNTEWTFRHEGTNYLVDAIWDGRELRAIIRRARGDEPARTPRPITNNQDGRAPLREEFAPRKKDPRADESQSLGAVREERTVTRAKTIDPRADEDSPPRPIPREPTIDPRPLRDPPREPPHEPPRDVRGEKRRDSRARRTTPRATGRPGSKRDLPKQDLPKQDLPKQDPPSEPRRQPPAATRPADDAKAAWTQLVGGSPPKVDPLFTLDKPDPEVRNLRIDPDDAYSREKLSNDQRVARAKTAHAPDISEMSAKLAEAQVARDLAMRGKAPERGRNEGERDMTVRAPSPQERERTLGRDREPARERDGDLPPVFGMGGAETRPPTGKRDLPKSEEPKREPPRVEEARPRTGVGAEFLFDEPPPRRERSSPTEPDRPPTGRGATDVEAARPATGAKPVPPPPPSSPETIEPARKAAAVLALAPRSPLDTAGSLDPALEKLVEQARTGGASDLHVVAGRPAIARIGGALVPAGSALSAETVEAMILATIPAHRRASFERDGAASFACVVGTSARCRVAVSRQRTGLKASIRILPPEPKSLGELELPEALDQALRHHQGLIVISGPSGQGKTTTLAAMVDHINTNSTHHVLTVEDPIEFVHSRKKAMMSQREVGTHTLSFANALRSSLREDPDVIVVGELRDVETVRTALSASETGHLVLGTINTPSAPKTIDRLIDLFPPPEQPQVRATLAGALRLIASQRLIPRRDGGGRVAAVEILPGSLALSNLIRDNRTFQIPSLMQRGRGAGVVRLDDELLELVRRGVVDRKDALAACDDPTELQSNLEGRGGGGDARPRPATGEPAGPGPKPPPTADDIEGRGGKALWQRAADMFRRGGG